ncbi:DUF499 domain-containing protein [Microbispora sp. KK1-11]|uniref:DUF499 domain-containing protein n=1 Tax=Microbispora sp. KK1-11 TaxID=2053005 RepID=UPI001156CC6F|nr:DUF499 domain-containing protein [Microbispora sp. KK1-11]TQS21373.1 DUF499 domain-containing protein [Microbispora sp. KK1-11]
MTASPSSSHWADILSLRDEVRLTDGSVGELQMSLAKAVYQTVLVPYAKCEYYTDITQPTPLLVGFLGRVARRLGVRGVEAQACFHLDQGMGGGKSHALVGLWHMINDSASFFGSELGHAVAAEATAGGYTFDLSQVVPVILIGESMSPGKTDPRFGPATDLFGRFLWLAFHGHPDRMGRWRHYNDLGANKATLQAVFAELGRPVLIVIDELMDYAMALTDQAAIGGLPGEQAFLNALADAVDDQPQVALVVVMIRSDEDQAGYHPAAEEMREYVAARLRRNGETVTVTEPADFAQIIRRRLFTRAKVDKAARAVADVYLAAADETWTKHVYGKLGPGRSLARLTDRIVETYPFHPDLFELVSKEWSVVQAFQRVRSTVAIFARTVLYWVTEHEAGRWTPDLIGPGDIPLHTSALEALLSSGVLAGNDRAIQGFRAVANTDIIRSGGGSGTAFALDANLAANGVSAGQPAPALRMATACFVYSLVPRAQAARGATKAELIAALAGSDVPYAAAEEIFNALIAGPAEGGLGALDRTQPRHSKGPEWFFLSIKQTLSMYHSNATTMVSNDLALDRVWKRAQQLASKGAFSNLHFVARSINGVTTAAACFADVDGQENRLVVLDPRRWSLLNGKDADTRADLAVAFGVAPGLTTTYAASMVVTMVNTQRRTRARDRARDVLAWELVVAQLDPTDDEYSEACSRRDEARMKLDSDIKWAYQHYAYLLRTTDGLTVQYKTVPDSKTALAGQDVWADLVAASRAVASGALAPEYVGQLITGGSFGRDLTPRELFALPYNNPTWPMVATVEDLRQALFSLATSSEWMLTDSDGNEIRPATPGQIQPASMQQLLRRRPTSIPKPPPEAAPGSESTLAVDPTSTGDSIGESASTTSVPAQAVEEPTYEVTRVRMPLSSLTDDSRREAVWGLIRELASLVDPAKLNMDIQMIGLDITVTARTGDTYHFVTKAKSLPGVTSVIEEEGL